MTAVITDAFRTNLVKLFYDEIVSTSDSNEYYIGVGKADYHGDSDIIPTTFRTLYEERLARGNLQSLKKVETSSFVIPRYNWAQGAIYSAYSDAVQGIPANTYYVMTEYNEVYICLQQGKNSQGNPVASTVQPNYITAGVNQKQSFRTTDGYVWKFYYTLSAVKARDFLTASYIPIQKIEWTQTGDSAGLNDFELTQLSIQKAASPGQVVGVRLTNGGSGYTSAPTVTIRGNGTSAAATATVYAGAVVKIEMDNESAALGVNYDYADIVLSGGGGTGAEAFPIIGPLDGLGADPRDEFKATSVMMVVQPSGTVDGTWRIDQDFRQIVLLKNPKLYSGAYLTATSVNALRSLKMTNSIEPAAFDDQEDQLFIGQTSGARAYVDDVDSSVIYYHQNEKTGFKAFQADETIADSGGAISAVIDSAGASPLVNGTVNPYTGKIYYVENRARVLRNEDQQEDIKVIITL